MEVNKRQLHYQTNRTSYFEGNAVRKLNTVPDIQRHGRPHEAPSTTPRRQRRRRAKSLSGITFTSLLVLSVAIAATVFTCVEYLMLQNNVSQLEKTLIAMEESLDQKIKANDAAYDQMNQAYDLEYIYKVAVEELGMVYPNNNTIITYQKSNSDYVKQFSDIPK